MSIACARSEPQILSDELEQLALGELPYARAAAVAGHARACPACARELAWLRLECAAVTRWSARGDADTGRLLRGVERRIAPKRPRQPWLRAGLALAACAAAALFAFALRERPRALARSAARARAEAWPDSTPGAEEQTTPSAQRALASAEHDYEAAISTLESRLATRQRRAPHALNQARTVLSQARDRAASSHDSAARVRLLEGYAAYMKSLRRALDEPPAPPRAKGRE